ncbi:MAG: sugar transferase [Geminicoccaceae bacterium]
MRPTTHHPGSRLPAPRAREHGRGRAGLRLPRGTSMKRALDLVLAGLALLPAILLAALVALALRLAQGRPILFSQERAGLRNEPFRLVKFRTMTDARDEAGRPLPDDARLTPLGRGLRRLRLDELPQILHVLLGQMSVVGPRPLLPETVSALGTLGDKRGQIRPGLTGWAQVNGNTLLDLEAKIALDVWYVDHWSFWLDVLILAKTVQCVIFGERIRREPIARAMDHAFGSGRRG